MADSMKETITKLFEYHINRIDEGVMKKENIRLRDSDPDLPSTSLAAMFMFANPPYMIICLDAFTRRMTEVINDNVIETLRHEIGHNMFGGIHSEEGERLTKIIKIFKDESTSQHKNP